MIGYSLMTSRVLATPEAGMKIEHLKEKHGELAFYQSGHDAEVGDRVAFTVVATRTHLRSGHERGAPVGRHVSRRQRIGHRLGRPR